jgi:hypothetical protein
MHGTRMARPDRRANRMSERPTVVAGGPDQTPDDSGRAVTSARLESMAFGQQSGPPASARQVKELLGLLQGLGHTDFRDARGPMGFTQRQAGGRFTSDEAAALIDRLHETELDVSDPATAAVERPAPDRARRAAPAATPIEPPAGLDRALRNARAGLLAAELRRRGWTVTEPDGVGPRD